MPWFDVEVPRGRSPEDHVVLRLRADSWDAAFRLGLVTVGTRPELFQDFAVQTLSPAHIQLRHPQSGGVFHVRTVDKKPEPRAADLPLRRVLPLVSLAEVRHARGSKSLRQPGAWEPESAPTAPERAPGPVPAPEVATTAVDVPPAPLRPRKVPRGHKHRPALRLPDSPEALASARARREDLLLTLFERAEELQTFDAPEDALPFLLDLALAYVGGEGGTLFLAERHTGELRVAAARGHRARALLKAKAVVPPGQGIAGHCISKGVAVALAEPEADPRLWFGEVAQRFDEPVGALVSVPMMTEGSSFGCVQLYDFQDGATFVEDPVPLLAYLAHHAARLLAAAPA